FILSLQATTEHLMSIMVMVNEKFREGVPPWETFKAKPQHFRDFFQSIMELSLSDNEVLSVREQSIILVFLIHCFNSLEMDLIREQLQHLVSLPMWICLLPERLEQELKSVAKYRKYWNHIKRKEAKAEEQVKAVQEKERKYLSSLAQKFLAILDSIPETGAVDMDKVHYCERFMELLIDLEVKCHLSQLAKRETEGRLFKQLLDMLKFYTGFEINDVTGMALTDHEMVDIHYTKMASLQALNQLFEKIMALDIEERHLLRLGHGEEALETEKDFSRYGRVNFVLASRLELLKEVQRLQESLNVHGDVSYTCETAGYFYLYQVVSRWEEYMSKLKTQKGDALAISELFPFTKFFENAPQPVFKGESFEDDMEIAEGCYRYIKKIFEQLEGFRAFELLRSGRDRTNYLLVKEAKIIAMTCTHAALKRRDLVELGFKYDNVLMEEAAQILEIETFIPLLLQNPEDGYNRMKRVILIGDHHQLPPVIKNMAFQKFSNMEQSLFTRFVRLGVPTVQLDAQGRARSSLCNLYNWRYTKLGDLPHVHTWPEYCVENPGFFFDFQLVDVPDFNGVGESEPNPYFYQNLGEAEYAVAIFMYMRLIGYPADKIAILTTYNGQKHLIRDVIRQRCANNPLIGQPSKVTTVDRYQGQQNDYIILSLVRTKTVGHIRDVRRLVVAMSRARLGLYVLARVSLFKNCFELRPAFSQLTSRPLKLYLAANERYPPCRPRGVQPSDVPFIVEDMPHMHRFVYDFYSHYVQSLRAQQQSMASIPQPPEEKETKTEETQENNDEEPDKTDTEKESDLEQEQGSPIVNEVEEMEAAGN
ncbi:PREDICTED: intron-binding protein aquarius-like, partial [Acropora digitifera]|uniref:intron-binding protein aquarius-like n=1 Tax=Acropora digitifera TaxID=70779 RepID=UPI00077B2110